MFSLVFALAALASGALTGSLILWADPYGVLVRKASAQTVLMDSNQRFMYPQIVRSGRFDAAVIGTSSTRLLDPHQLSGLMGARFANLAMNAATPWEQARMMELAWANWAEEARTGPGGTAARAVIWGLDATWCASDADSPAKRLTPRPFPEWLYQSGARTPSVVHWPQMANLTTLEIAGRRLFHAMGLAPERMRADGYDEFTPPDASFDLARAQFHLYQGRPPQSFRDHTPDAPLTLHKEANQHFPALAWLETALAALPPATRKVIILPPVHAASLSVEGDPMRLAEANCKLALLKLSQRVGATLLDYRVVSPLTSDDTAFWDPLHYRVAIARRIAQDIALADSQGRPPGRDGVLRNWQGPDTQPPKAAPRT
jgi:hypothetical protein